MVLTCVISILLLGLYFISRKDEKEENERNGTEREEKTKRKLQLRILGLIPAIVAIIVFIMTEDLTQPMELVDRYTMLMVLILLVEAVIAFFARKTQDEDTQEAEEDA